MPEMTSMGWPSAASASPRKVESSRARRIVLVPAARTLSACMDWSRSPNWERHTRRALARVSRQGPVLGKSLGQPHGLAQPVDDRELPVAQLADDHVETVGAEVNCGDDLRLDGTHVRLQTSGSERLSAPARGGCVRIPDHELRAPQILGVVDFGAHQVLHAHRVDEQRYAAIFTRLSPSSTCSSKVNPY